MISQQICEEMLQEHGVKPTANRIVVVKALADAERPLSLSELERMVATGCATSYATATTVMSTTTTSTCTSTANAATALSVSTRCPYPPSCFPRGIGCTALTTWPRDSVRSVLQRDVRLLIIPQSRGTSAERYRDEPCRWQQPRAQDERHSL